MPKSSPIGDPPVPEETATPQPTRRIFLPLVATSLATLAASRLPAEAKPAVSNADAGTIWWSELRTRDPARARSFYAGAIGWVAKTVAQDDPARPAVPGERGYTLFMMRGQEAAGAEELEADDAATRPGWFIYVQVDDVDETVKKVIALGGKVIQHPIDIAAVGRMAEIEDPEGNRLGLVSPRA
jgi:predicted enzyme related to lactoylglutathione lyase